MISFKLKEKGYTYFIDFRHDHNPITHTLYGSITYCEIVLKETNRVIARGDSICVPQDNFCKDFGRKLSLKRALTNLSFNKLERKIVWDAYHNR